MHKLRPLLFMFLLVAMFLLAGSVGLAQSSSTVAFAWGAHVIELETVYSEMAGSPGVRHVSSVLGRLFIPEPTDQIRTIQNGDRSATPLLDISASCRL